MDANTVKTVADAIQLGVELTTGAGNLLSAAGEVATLVAAAQAEGRELTADDWAKLDAADQAARASLDAAIAQRKAIASNLATLGAG